MPQSSKGYNWNDLYTLFSVERAVNEHLFDRFESEAALLMSDIFRAGVFMMMFVSISVLIKQRWNKQSQHAESQTSASACRSAAPPFARELHIEAVISPDYGSHGPFDTLLHTHFSSPRLYSAFYNTVFESSFREHFRHSSV